MIFASGTEVFQILCLFLHQMLAQTGVILLTVRAQNYIHIGWKGVVQGMQLSFGGFNIYCPRTASVILFPWTPHGMLLKAYFIAQETHE